MAVAMATALRLMRQGSNFSNIIGVEIEGELLETCRPQVSIEATHFINIGRENVNLSEGKKGLILPYFAVGDNTM